MGIIAYLIMLVVSGLVVGGLARLAVPGRQQMSLVQTFLLGLAGSFIGGLVGRVLFRGGFGLVLSVLAAALLLFAMTRRGRITSN
ncbi:MAG: hypothetical protein OEY23_02255 [Acidimicrobiia bacterium]|nr:hypothetical protein [Acidimicrobiia bacterium]